MLKKHKENKQWISLRFLHLETFNNTYHIWDKQKPVLAKDMSGISIINDWYPKYGRKVKSKYDDPQFSITNKQPTGRNVTRKH